jgi:hypothetical protein
MIRGSDQQEPSPLEATGGDAPIILKVSIGDLDRPDFLQIVLQLAERENIRLVLEDRGRPSARDNR